MKPGPRWLLVSVLVGACDPTDRQGTPAEVGLTAGEGAAVAPPTAVDPSVAASRNGRRMDLDQLGHAIREVTGGLGWTEDRGGHETDLFAELASTLGKPDFIQITEEDLTRSAMFQKFLDAAARSVCARLVAREVSSPREARVFFVYADPDRSLSSDPPAVLRNVRYLLLRFHGRAVPVDGPEIEPWRRWIASVEQASRDAQDAWRAVCVGLMTHPDFYTY